MKEILLFGRVEKEDAICRHVEDGAEYKIRQTVQVRKARQFIRKREPEFMLVSGQIEIDKDGNYCIQL